MIEATHVLDRQLLERLATAPVAWFGTVRPDARPHLTPVWFDSVGDELIDFAQPGDQKIRNLRQLPNVTLGIPFDAEAGAVALIEGIARIQEEPDRNGIPHHYLEKYQGLIDAYGWDAATLNRQYSVQIRIRPTRVIGW